MKKMWKALLGVFFLVGCASYPPADLTGDARGPILKPNQEVKILCWNVQYMAGKTYVFWYDVADGSGTDTRPSKEAVDLTLQEVARVIKEENPDIVLLQELDDGSKRTDYRDQIQELQSQLAGLFPYESTAYYHNVSYVPIKEIKGRVGMKLATFSRYQIDEALRHQLPLKDTSALVRHFDFHRCILETRLPVEGGGVLSVMNTHMSAFSQGDDTMDRQVAFIRDLMNEREEEGALWVFGGDTNLLPPGPAYEDLPVKQQFWYNSETELSGLIELYPSVPSLSEVSGEKRREWYTYYPNDHEDAGGPDRVLDYLFYTPRLILEEHYVRQDDTLEISDHLPVVARFFIPE